MPVFLKMTAAITARNEMIKITTLIFPMTFIFGERRFAIPNVVLQTPRAKTSHVWGSLKIAIRLGRRSTYSRMFNESKIASTPVMMKLNPITFLKK